MATLKTDQIKLYAEWGEILIPLGIGLIADVQKILKGHGGLDLTALLEEADANWRLVKERAQKP